MCAYVLCVCMYCVCVCRERETHTHLFVGVGELDTLDEREGCIAFACFEFARHCMHGTRIVIGDVAQVFLDVVNTGGSDGGADHTLFIVKKKLESQFASKFTTHEYYAKDFGN